MNLNLNLCLDPAAIRPALQALEEHAARIAALYQALSSLVSATERLPARALAPATTTTAAKTEAPLNHRKVEPPTKPTVRRTGSPLPLQGPPPSKRPGKRDDRIVAFVAANQGLTATEIAGKLQTTVPNIFATLRRLVEEGRMVCGGDKKYRRCVAHDAEARVN